MRLEEGRMFCPSLRRASTSTLLVEANGSSAGKHAMLQLDTFSHEQPLKSSNSTEKSTPESPVGNSANDSPFKKCDSNHNLFTYVVHILI